MCTLLLCNKNYRLRCLFKRGKCFSLCKCTRSFARSDDAKIVRSRYAQCNTEESPKTIFCHFNAFVLSFIQNLVIVFLKCVPEK